MVLPCFKILACAVIQLLPPVSSAGNAGEHIRLAYSRWAAFVLPQFLHPLPCVGVNNRFVGVLKYKPFFLWVVTGLFALEGLLIGLEVPYAPDTPVAPKCRLWYRPSSYKDCLAARSLSPCLFAENGLSAL